MLPILIYIADILRRALRRLVRSVTIVAETFHEAQEMRRSMPNRHMDE